MVVLLETTSCGICNHDHNGKSVIDDDHDYEENTLLTSNVLKENKKRYEATKDLKERNRRVQLITSKSVIADLQQSGYIVGCAFSSAIHKDTIVIPYSRREYYEKHQR